MISIKACSFWLFQRGFQIGLGTGIEAVMVLTLIFLGKF